MTLDEINRLRTAVEGEIAKVIVGQAQAVELLLIALLAQGHVLLEGAPGTAKTLLARCFASSLSLSFGRVQFTPDLMPGDLLGTNLFNFQANQFVFVAGPIFTELLLADEINRTPPKTQAALLEAMAERSVTTDGQKRELGSGFMVVATQNPIEQQGTYPLPEAQLDRFLFKHVLPYPSRDDELAIVAAHGHQTATPTPQSGGIVPVADLAALDRARGTIAGFTIKDSVIAYIVDLARATRDHPAIQHGVSPRAAAMLASSSRARAALEARDYVIPDDVKTLALPVFRHRIVLAAGAEIDGLNADAVVTEIVNRLEPPR
jgi:MoxR-like ATPase